MSKGRSNCSTKTSSGGTALDVRATTSGGGLVINQQGKILVVQQLDGTWSLPKGHTESGESPYDAALREIDEEASLSCSKLKFIDCLGEYRRYKEKSRYGQPELKTIVVFLFFVDGDLFTEAADTLRVSWETADRVRDLLSYVEDREFFLRVVGKALKKWQAMHSQQG
jgi:ADP-ribose pyrophosphatase YjhB (NUDIX family)